VIQSESVETIRKIYKNLNILLLLKTYLEGTIVEFHVGRYGGADCLFKIPDTHSS
jgi:hypothetical protein